MFQKKASRDTEEEGSRSRPWRVPQERSPQRLDCVQVGAIGIQPTSPPPARRQTPPARHNPPWRPLKRITSTARSRQEIHPPSLFSHSSHSSPLPAHQHTLPLMLESMEARRRGAIDVSGTAWDWLVAGVHWWWEGARFWCLWLLG